MDILAFCDALWETADETSLLHATYSKRDICILISPNPRSSERLEQCIASTSTRSALTPSRSPPAAETPLRGLCLVNPASFETCALPLMISSVVCKSRFAELHLVTASLAAACENPSGKVLLVI